MNNSIDYPILYGLAANCMIFWKAANEFDGGVVSFVGSHFNYERKCLVCSERFLKSKRILHRCCS
jgi:hypothetical protein